MARFCLKSIKAHPSFGIFCAMGAFFMFALMNVFAKKLSVHHSVIEVAFYRNLIATLPFLYLIYGRGQRDILVIKSNPKTVVFRSILGTISLGFTFAAFAVMPLAEVTAFLFTASLIIPMLGFFFLGEHVGKYRWSAIVVGFLGVLVMLNPTGAVNMQGAFLALSAASMHAILQTILRSLGKTEKPETVTVYFVFIGTFVTLVAMPLVFVMPTWQDLPSIIGVGLTGVLAQFLLSSAYKNTQAATVTVFNYSGLIWATLFGWMFWNEWPSHSIWIGGAIVIASNIFILYRENKLAKLARASVQKTEVI